MGFIYNGIEKDYVSIDYAEFRPTFAPRKLELISVPGMPGSYLNKVNTEVRVLNIPVLVYYNDFADLQKKKEDFSGWLIHDTPRELKFHDELDRTYFAVVDNSFNLDEMFRVGKGTITFVCPDPFKYGDIQTVIPSSDTFICTNGGNEKCYPVIKAIAKNPITHIDVIAENAYMRLGKLVDVGMTPKPPETTKLIDEMNNLVGWSNTAAGIIDGSIAGTMSADQYRFYCDAYGTGVGWHGPAKTKVIPNGPITDFKMEVVFELLNTNVMNNGRAEIYLIDNSNKVVCKVAIKNIDKGSNRNYAEIRIGDNVINYFIVNEYGERESTWANFYGMLRVSRVGNKWEAYVAQVNRETGEHYARRYAAYVDDDNQFTRKPNAVVAHLGQYGANSVTTNRIYKISIYEMNSISETEIPYIATAGDVIVLDHKTGLYTINGENRIDLKTFGSTPFPLLPGNNALVMVPFEDLESVEITYREAYK